MARLDWNGDNSEDAIKAAAWERIQRATVYLHTQLQHTLNVSNPRPYKTPSAPGEPPRKRTAWLQRHVTYELDPDKLQSRVGVAVNALYGVFLELGTSRMRARPWLWATVKKCWTQLQAIMKG